MKPVEFGSLFEFIRNGMNIKQDKSGTGLPITRIETISNAKIDSSRVGYAGLKDEDCGNWLLAPGDILFSHINSVEHLGKCAVYNGKPEKLVHGMNLLCLRPNKEEVFPDFVKYLIRDGVFRDVLSKSIKKAVNQASISISDIRKIPVSLPSLPEQRRIAAILDQADGLRAKRREALAKLDEMAQAIFVEMFGEDGLAAQGTTTAQLADVVRKDTIITYGIVQAGEEFPGGVPYIRTGDLVAGEIRLDKLRHTDPALAKKFKRSRVETGDIVMSIRATVGTTALVPNILDGANLTQGTAKISPGDRVDRYYLLTFLRNESTQTWIERQVKGATFREITLAKLRELPVAVPPQKLQKVFAERLHQLNQLKQRAQVSLNEMDGLFSSLQDRAFSGDL